MELLIFLSHTAPQNTCVCVCIPVYAQLEPLCIHREVYRLMHTPPHTRFNSFAPIATAELGLRESSDRSLLAQLSHPD